MHTVIDTLADYEAFMKYERRRKPESIRAAKLSLRYFTELYGDTLTTRLQPDDMFAFYEHLK